MNSLRKFQTIGIAQTLGECRLFAGLTPDDLDHIAEITQIRSLQKNEPLFHAGDPVLGFYIIRRGAINIHRVNASGDLHVIHIFRTGESFAEAALTMPSGYPANASALESTELLFVQKEGILALIRRHPELALRIIASTSAHMHTLVDKLESLAFENLETRLAHWLLEHCLASDADAPCEILLTIPKRTLASQLGTINQTLSRIFAKFRAQKLIAICGKRITVFSPAKLRAFAQS